MPVWVKGVSRELARLTDAGIVSLTRQGNQSHYQANPACPIYAELKAWWEKPWGGKCCAASPGALVARRLQALRVAGERRGTRGSDVDVMLVGRSEP